MRRCLLASGDDAFHARLQAALNRPDDEVLRLPAGTTLAAVVDAARRELPHVVLIGPDIETSTGLAVAQRLDEERPDVGVVLVTHGSPAVWEQALRAGVRDLLEPNADAPAIRAVVDRAGEIAERLRTRAPETPAPRRGRIVVVLSPKGGTGKTTVAANLATALAMIAPNQVVAVDADLQFGDLSVAFQLMPEGTIADAVRVVDDPVALKGLLTQQHGVHVLAAPPDPATGELVTGEQVAAVVDALAAAFPFVVVDTAAELPPQTLSLVEVATDLVLIASMDVPSVRQLRKELDALDAVGLTAAARHLVLNRADSKVGLAVKDIEGALGMAVSCAIPSSRVVPLSMNSGEPVIAGQPKTPVARQLWQLAGRFATLPSPRPTRPTHR